MAITIPESGTPITAAWARQVANAANGMKVRSGNGILASQSPNGVTLSLDHRMVGGGFESPSAYAFKVSKIILADDKDEASWCCCLPAMCLSYQGVQIEVHKDFNNNDLEVAEISTVHGEGKSIPVDRDMNVYKCSFPSDTGSSQESFTIHCVIIDFKGDGASQDSEKIGVITDTLDFGSLGINQSGDGGNKYVYSFPIASVDSDGRVTQLVKGAVVLGGGGRNYIPGDGIKMTDSEGTEITDEETLASAVGAIKINAVYVNEEDEEDEDSGTTT